MVYKVKEETIESIANAIRTKRNSTEDIQVEDFAAEILNIETGENTTSAAQSARDAEASAISAASSAQAAKEDAADSAEGALTSEAWAVGKRLGKDVPVGHEAYQNNAKYYSEIAGGHEGIAKECADKAIASEVNAKISEKNASASEAAAKASEEQSKANLDRTQYLLENVEGFNSEAWAVGTRNGVEVGSYDETYQNNAKYWSDTARATVKDFQASTGTANILATATLVEEVTS